MQVRLNVTILMMCRPSWRDESVMCVGCLFDDAGGAILCVCVMNPQQAEERLRGAPNEMQDKRVVPQREALSKNTHVTIDMFRKKKKRSKKPRARWALRGEDEARFLTLGAHRSNMFHGPQTSDGKCLTRSRFGQESQAHGHRCVQESKVVDAGER